ncbi:MAG TPA: DUF559 domain-containing protein [Marmoricola sp.]|nr:DUF559 domain-containing protein [Marmoricola sp.]
MADQLDTSRPFTRADAVAAGIDTRILRTSRFRRLFRQVYVARRSADPHQLIRAALVLHPPTAYASHHSAARFYGLPVPHDPKVHVTVLAAEDRRHHPGIRCHVTTREPHVIDHDDIRVSHPFLMFVELAGVIDLVNLVVVGDALVKMFDIPPERLLAYCQASERHHAATASLAASYVRSAVDSPMETRLRMLIVLAGLPEPEVNFKFYDANGRVRRRLDLSYPAIRLIIEYDGRQHAESIEQWGEDLDRREEFDDAEWRILVVRSDGIYQHPERTLRRIRRQLIARGWPQVPPLGDGWRVHFPGRRSAA